MEYDIYELIRTAVYAGTAYKMISLFPVNVPVFLLFCVINVSYFQDLDAKQKVHDEQVATEIVADSVVVK